MASNSMALKTATTSLTEGNQNRLLAQDRAAHDWYRFVLSFPPHLVRDYLERFGIDPKKRVLDPFCGTGTTLVECKKHGVPSVGIEANPMAAFASRVKTDWRVDPDGLLEHAHRIADRTLQALQLDGISDDVFLRNSEGRKRELRSLSSRQNALLLKGSISPLPLHKVLVLLETIARHRDASFCDHERLALAKALVQAIGNLHFGPEVGVGSAKSDAPVVPSWLDCVYPMVQDLRELRAPQDSEVTVRPGDSRDVAGLLEPKSIDAVITSPPYPNEKDYTRTTRLESVLLGLIRDRAGLRDLKEGLVRSNTRNVFVKDADDRYVVENTRIQGIAAAIEKKRIELGKTSGFERLYARVTKLYFGGMARHLAGLRTVLRPGAHLAYVVGDQASYLRVMIRTGEILAYIAQSLGYKLVDIELFRTRLATATREQLREEVVILCWPGR